MSNKIIQVFLVFVVILVLAGFSIVLSSKQSNILSVLPPESQIGSSGNQDSALIVEKHYSSDAYTFTGSVMADEGCSTLSTGVDLEQDNPEKITLTFDTETEAIPDDCKTPTPRKDFIVVVPTSEGAQLEKVIFNGVSVAFELRAQ